MKMLLRWLRDAMVGAELHPLRKPPMPKKRAGSKPMKTIEKDKTGKAVRLILPVAEHARLEQIAKAKGLSLASYARMSVLERMKADEGK